MLKLTGIQSSLILASLFGIESVLTYSFVGLGSLKVLVLSVSHTLDSLQSETRLDGWGNL